jgi:hypothetical protein
MGSYMLVGWVGVCVGGGGGDVAVGVVGGVLWVWVCVGVVMVANPLP